MVPQCFNLRTHLLKSIVHVIRFITNRKYAFYFIYQVKLSPDNISLNHWIKIDHVLLQMIMIDSCGTVHQSRIAITVSEQFIPDLPGKYSGVLPLVGLYTVHDPRGGHFRFAAPDGRPTELHHWLVVTRRCET